MRFAERFSWTDVKGTARRKVRNKRKRIKTESDNKSNVRHQKNTMNLQGRSNKWVSIAAMEVFSIVESRMICRFGLQSGSDSKAKIRALDSYGIFKVNHDFVASNDALALNSVPNSSVSLAYRSEYDYKQRHGVSRPPELDARRLADKKAAVNDKVGLCPVEGCSKQLITDGRDFHQPTKQWVYNTCKARSLYHNNELTPSECVGSVVVDFSENK